MADEIPAAVPGVPAPRMIKQTHKQAFFTYGSTVILAMTLKGPLGEFFQTKEDAAKQTASIAIQANQIQNLKDTMDSNKKDIIEAFNLVVKPVAKQVDGHDTRIVNLEFILMNKGSKK